MGEMVDRGEVLQRISLSQPISLSVLTFAAGPHWQWVRQYCDNIVIKFGAEVARRQNHNEVRHTDMSPGAPRLSGKETLKHVFCSSQKRS